MRFQFPQNERYAQGHQQGDDLRQMNVLRFEQAGNALLKAKHSTGLSIINIAALVTKPILSTCDKAQFSSRHHSESETGPR
ncbi:MAG: hypothetical protein A2X58_08490 [Nitrospirae bacterium GWC2_56_14]|nr:MAG: hypothetical protein A2X58_08490 [Nitrospirae bacterium GWC2_56_14]